MANADLIAKSERLLALHIPGQPLVLPNAWDAGTAKIIAAEGFHAIATTSAGIAFTHGYADGEAIPGATMMEAVARIARAVHVPVTADIEASYGIEPETVAGAVRALIAAGVAGANIQDRSEARGSALFDFGLSVARIRAARKAADAAGVPFVVNARTDVFIISTWDDREAAFAEAVRRLNAYKSAGADCLFAPFVPAPELVGRLVKALNGPLNMLQPRFTVAKLAALGVARVSFGGTLVRAALGTVRQAAREIRDLGTVGFAANAIDNRELNDLMAGRQRAAVAGCSKEG